jgi:hypothetical protein
MSETEQSIPKRAVLLDPGGDERLHPFLERHSVAMLPVGNKPLVQYWCEFLAEAGFRDILLVLSHFPEQVRGLVEGGERWGLNVSVYNARENTPPGKMLASARGFITEPTLVTCLDSLPLPPFLDWMTRASAEADPAVCGTAEHAACPTGIATPDWMADNCGGEVRKRILLPEGAIRRIDSPEALWQANMDLLDGKIEDRLPPGFEAGEGILTGLGAQIRPSARIEGPCRIGTYSMVGNRVQVGPRVSIGSSCIIDEASQVTDSVIFDHTFVGSHSELNNALVDGRMVYRVDHGIATWIDDPLILGSTHAETQADSLDHRLLAALLLLLLSPFLLLRLAGLLLRGRSPWETDEVVVPAGRDLSGAPAFLRKSLRSLNVRHTLWRKVPWLWSVIRGDMPLFGVTPRDQEHPDIPDWARELVMEEPGVITLADVTGDILDGPYSESVLVTDSFYLATRGRKADTLLTLRWLLGLFRRQPPISNKN